MKSASLDYQSPTHRQFVGEGACFCRSILLRRRSDQRPRTVHDRTRSAADLSGITPLPSTIPELLKQESTLNTGQWHRSSCVAVLPRAVHEGRCETLSVYGPCKFEATSTTCMHSCTCNECTVRISDVVHATSDTLSTTDFLFFQR